MFVFIAIIALGVLIVVHEFGHFIVAKKLGVKVLKFSVGFGPKIFGKTVNGTEYALSAIPLGGFVKMAGEDPENPDEQVDPLTSFSHQKLWRRTAIVSAGPLFNIAFAYILLTGIYLVLGEAVPNDSARIGAVHNDTPAMAAGVQAGDLVRSADGKPIAVWSELQAAIRESGGKEVSLEVERGTEKIVLKVTPKETEQRNQDLDVIGKAFVIGILPSVDRRPVSFGMAFVYGGEHTVSMARSLVLGLVKLIQGSIPRSELGGPLQIVKEGSSRAQNGLESLLIFVSFISINLGVLNFLPIPILDGGHLVFFALEAIMRRPLDLRHREIAQQVGLVMLVGLMAFAFYNDIARMLVG